MARTSNDWAAFLKAEREGRELPGTCVREMARDTGQVFITAADVKALAEAAKTPELRKLLTDLARAADQIAAARAALDKRQLETDTYVKEELAKLGAAVAKHERQMDDDRKAPPKQRHYATHIHQRLVRE